jgi:integrase
MARGSERLSARAIQGAKERGLHADGKGLYLRVGPTGSKSWIYRYRVADRQHDLGLGPYPEIGLADARERAMQQRRLRLNGHDPLTARRSASLDAVAAVTFAEAAERYITAHAAGWRGGKNESQWRQSLTDYAFPTLGNLPVPAIDVGHVLKSIEPLWTAKPETASRVRGRIESILDWATARGYRSGENPARWRGHLENLLPARSKVRKVEHYPALPYPEIGPFMAELRGRGGMATRALEFAILTAARSGEVLGARWDEFDLAAKVWTVPAERMKAGKEHRVPLSDAAIAALPERTGGLVFPGVKPGQPVTGTALWKAIKRPGFTVHGFRSTFSQWSAERTSYPFEVREMALAHAVGSAVERSYQRSDLFDRRRKLMEEWARFCDQPVASAGTVVSLHAAV